MKKRASVLLLCVGCILAGGTSRAFSQRQQSPVASATQSANVTAPAYRLPPARLRKAQALGRIREVLAVGAPAWIVLVLLLALTLRWPPRLRDWAEQITPRLWLQGLLFLPLVIVFIVLIPLPLELYGHHVARAYGLSVEGWGGWAADWLKSLGLSLVVWTPLLLLLFALVRHSPRKWWLWFWLAVLPIVVFGVFISPMWIDPMFHHFSPLEKSDPALTAQLERLAHHAGLDIPPSRMFLMRASDKVTGLNAYVTGIGASKRIVVWDTTIHKLPTNEILFIAGHEMGHYVLDHIYKGLAFTALVMFFGLWLVYGTLGWLLRRFGPRWGIRALDDWAALAAMVLVFVAFTFLFSPIANSFSRWEEHQADIFGQEAIHGLVANPQQTAERAFTALGTAYLEAPHPNPWFAFWFDSHPTTAQRFQFAEHYHPWLPGHHPRYFPR